MRLTIWIRQHLAALRALLALTVITGVLYPLGVWAVAQTARPARQGERLD